jgi:hypothetical protein
MINEMKKQYDQIESNESSFMTGRGNESGTVWEPQEAEKPSVVTFG